MSDAASAPPPSYPPPLSLAGQPPAGVPVERLQLSMRQFKDGDLALPSATLRPDGKPRFVMPLHRSAMETDLAVAYMVRHEVLHDGFERPTRDLIDAHLEPGDLFLDVGAHYGMMAFSAATRHPGKVRAIAIEAHPDNAGRVFKGVQLNKLEAEVETIAAAAGGHLHLASLAFNTTMGHSLLETAGRTKAGMLYVPVLPLDDILDGRAARAGRPIVG
jgi:FkbM family methyltransferase